MPSRFMIDSDTVGNDASCWCGFCLTFSVAGRKRGLPARGPSSLHWVSISIMHLMVEISAAITIARMLNAGYRSCLWLHMSMQMSLHIPIPILMLMDTPGVCMLYFICR